MGTQKGFTVVVLLVRPDVSVALAPHVARVRLGKASPEG
jgi:hypothetical protein